MIPQKEIDEAANNRAVEMKSDLKSMKMCKNDFNAGVKFAESKFEEIAIEFVKYSAQYGLYHIIHGDKKESFQQFIKERNENTK